ncbi:MAG: murein biosynthesis integral membrane protein MurJ [Akkermansia sp.]
MSSMHKKSLIATVAIFCCRFTGLLREVCFTAFFGATGALDAFLTAFRIPNMLRDMFGEGALSQSFTSEMSKIEQTDGPEEAWKLAHMVSSQLCAMMLIVVSLGVLTAGWVMQNLYPERTSIVLQVQPQLLQATEQKAVEQVLAEDALAADVLDVVKASDLAEEEAETEEVMMNDSLSLTDSKPAVQALLLRKQRGGDGEPQVVLACTSIPEGWSPQSCFVSSDVKRIPTKDVFDLSASMANGELSVQSRNYMEMAAQLCRVMWPFILFAALSALALGALNVFGLFGVPNLVSGAFNLTLIGVGIVLGWLIDPNFGPKSLYGFAIGVLVGGIVQVFCLLPLLRKQGFRPKFNLGLYWKGWRPHFMNVHARKVWVLMLPGLIAAGITQANIFINTSFSLYLPSGSVTALSCAFRLSQLPVALFGVALGMVVLPDVSRMTVAGPDKGSRAIALHLAKAIRFLSFFALPCAIFLGFWGEEIVSICFQRGRFDAAASAYTGQVLAAFSLGLLSYAGCKVLQPIFLALERPWPPAVLALFCCVVSITLNYLFVHHFHGNAAWLAATTATVTTLNFVFYFFFLRHLLGGMALATLIPGLLRILCAAAVLAVTCWWLEKMWMQGFTSWGFGLRVGTMALFGSLAGLCYLLASYLFRVPELMLFLNRILKRQAAELDEK